MLMKRTWNYKKPQLIQEKPEYEEKRRHTNRWDRGETDGEMHELQGYPL